MSEKQRRIVCAANRHPRMSEVMVLGVRHCDDLMWYLIQRYVEDEPFDWIQGFVDNKGIFLTREEAWVVARDAGQILEGTRVVEGVLYSENLY